MKKFFMLLSLIILSSGYVKAQSDSELVQIGVKAGVNSANISGDDLESSDSRVNFHIGVTAEIPFAPRFSVQPEVMYSGQGFKIEEVYTANDLIEYRLNYFQIPVLAKVYLIKGLNVQVGPQIGFQIKEEIEYMPNDNGDEVELNETEDIDLGIAGGIEYKFYNGVFIQVRYNSGFSELIDGYDVHNSVWQAGIGYMF